MEELGRKLNEYLKQRPVCSFKLYINTKHPGSFSPWYIVGYDAESAVKAMYCNTVYMLKLFNSLIDICRRRRASEITGIWMRWGKRLRSIWIATAIAIILLSFIGIPIVAILTINNPILLPTPLLILITLIYINHTVRKYMRDAYILGLIDTP